MKILIMTDFSGAAEQAATYGMHLAKRLGAEVWIQHVYYIPQDMAGEVFIQYEAMANYELKLQPKVARLKEQFTSLLPGEFRFFLSNGDLITEMNKLIDQEKIDLVVVGNRGNGFLTNILGSHTVKAIQHAHCPVLSIPKDAPFHPIENIAFAADLKQTSEKVLHQLVMFARLFQARVDVIHIRNSSNEQQEAATTLFELLQDIPHTYYYIWVNDIEKGIQLHVETHGNDLIILLPRTHSFFDRLFQRSISRQLAFHTKVPLLSIHE